LAKENFRRERRPPQLKTNLRTPFFVVFKSPRFLLFFFFRRKINQNDPGGVESFTALPQKLPLEKSFRKEKEKKPRKENLLYRRVKGTNPLHRAPYNSSKKLIKIDSGRVEKKKKAFTSPSLSPTKPLEIFSKGRKKPRKTNFLQASGGTNPPTEP
jgi:hypothetical protein